MPPSVRAELRSLLALALPLAAAQLSLVSMGLVDTAVVGRVTVNDLGGVALGRSISFACSTVCIGVALALEPVASQALGANDPARAWSAFLTTIRSAAMLCVPAVMLSVSITFTLKLFHVPAPVIACARAYIISQIPAQILMILFSTGKSFLQAHGDSRPVLIAAIVANLVNLIACVLMVLGDEALAWVHLPGIGLPRMGAFGAGLSTSVASVFLAGIVLHASRKHRVFGAKTAISIAQSLRLGVPIGLQMLAEVGVFTVVALLAARLGAEIVSAHQIALGLASFTFMTALGVGGATAARVGRSVGAGHSPRRVGLLGVALGTLIMALGAVVFASAPRLLMRAFTDDANVIAIGIPLLRIAALFQLFDGLQAVASGALRGAGDVRFPFVANVAAHWFLGFPVALVLGFVFKLGAVGLWLGLTAGLVAVAIALGARFLWLTSRVIQRV